MQARRSSLYRKVEEAGGPVTFFEDDFTTIADNAVLNGKTPSGGSGVWTDAVHTQASAKKRSGYPTAIANAQTRDFNTVYAIPPGELAGENRLRIKGRLQMRNGVSAAGLAGIGLWNTTAWNTGLLFNIYKVNTSDGHEAKFRYYDPAAIVIWESGTNELAGNVFLNYEIHAEKLSETSIKVGCKIEDVWKGNTPTTIAVTNGFCAVPNRASLTLRNQENSDSAALCNNLWIDNQVDW